jgi:hypothetical protein
VNPDGKERLTVRVGRGFSVSPAASTRGKREDGNEHECDKPTTSTNGDDDHEHETVDEHEVEDDEETDGEGERRARPRRRLVGRGRSAFTTGTRITRGAHDRETR